MKKFLLRLIIFIIVLFSGMEIFCRLVIDPVYFYKITTYNYKDKSASKLDRILKAYSKKPTRHIDYLFIGSSRVIATINPQVFTKKEPGKIAVVAGRGCMTSGIHYQAIKSRCAEYPDFLKNASVFLEFPNSKQSTKPFIEEHYRVYESKMPTEKDRAMPHLLLPYLDKNSLREFLKLSPNSRRIKTEMRLLYYSAAYRSISFIEDMMLKFDTPLFRNNQSVLTSEGGIRNDDIQKIREKAIQYTKFETEKNYDRRTLTMEALDKSTLASMNQLIKENGGTLFLYKMPLHSILDNIYHSEKEQANDKILAEWLNQNNIQIITADKFIYEDSDFPDIWHLSSTRRNEFTAMLYEAFRSGVCNPQGHGLINHEELDIVGRMLCPYLTIGSSDMIFIKTSAPRP